ncbi:hypothetical protein GE061_014238 [Apolygus lucorum]|uniref:Uncharacterized protein n=1 Tax=Apolygus lucorum TaxID=248454 RepID=A0A8S9XR74_APOLU|nr:hypothetical protein GE061_014238 [Apolygus lucorum]
MTEEVELFDVSSGKTYSVSLMPEDAQRAYNDPNLLFEILRVLTNNDENRDLVTKEADGSGTPVSSSPSSNVSSEQSIEVTHNKGDNQLESPGLSPDIVIPEIDVKQLSSVGEISDVGKSQSSTDNVTIEFIAESLGEESELSLDNKSATREVTFASLLRFFDSYKSNDDVISGTMTEKNYLEFQAYLQTAGWEWSVRSSSKAPKDWYIFNYEKGDLKIPYFGHPFVLKKNTLLECVHGDLYYGVTKKKQGKNAMRPKNDQHECVNSDSKSDEPPLKKRASKPTKKLSCPVFMKVVLVFYFPDYKIDSCEPLTWRNKNKVIQQLKRGIKLDKSTTSVAQYFVKMSLPNKHNHQISPPKAIIAPLKTNVTRHVNLKEQQSKINEIRDVCDKIVKLTNSPMKRGTSVKELQSVLDRLRDEHQSMESMFESGGANG